MAFGGGARCHGVHREPVDGWFRVAGVPVSPLAVALPRKPLFGSGTVTRAWPTSGFSLTGCLVCWCWWSRRVPRCLPGTGGWLVERGGCPAVVVGRRVRDRGSRSVSDDGRVGCGGPLGVLVLVAALGAPRLPGTGGWSVEGGGFRMLPLAAAFGITAFVLNRTTVAWGAAGRLACWYSWFHRVSPVVRTGGRSASPSAANLPRAPISFQGTVRERCSRRQSR